MTRRRSLATVLATVSIAIATAGFGSTALAATPAAPPTVTTSTPGIPNFLVSAIDINKTAHTATLPLYHGETPREGKAWFIITESSDLAEAHRLGVNWSPKLVNALGTAAVQKARLDDSERGHSRLSIGSEVRFSGGVDFSGARSVVPGPDLFPVDPATHAGPLADKKYSPLFSFGDGIVYNGAEVANSTGVHPKVLNLDTAHRRATVRLTQGFYLHRDVLYLSTEASVTQIAALENATYAPNLAAAPTAGNDDSAVSAREPIIPVVNGPRGATNPDRQGLQSAVAGEGDPLNIIREEPECTDPSNPANCSALDYSPLWDVHPVAWTQAAIDNGQRVRVTSHQDIESLFNKGLLVNAAPDGPINHDPEINGLRAAGVVVNCPPIFVAAA